MIASTEPQGHFIAFGGNRRARRSSARMRPTRPRQSRAAHGRAHTWLSQFRDRHLDGKFFDSGSSSRACVYALNPAGTAALEVFCGGKNARSTTSRTEREAVWTCTRTNLSLLECLGAAPHGQATGCFDLLALALPQLGNAHAFRPETHGGDCLCDELRQAGEGDGAFFEHGGSRHLDQWPTLLRVDLVDVDVGLLDDCCAHLGTCHPPCRR